MGAFNTQLPDRPEIDYDQVMKCPVISSTAIICDDAYLAALASARLAVKGKYLAVLDGPRMTRDDAPAEAVRKTNSLAMAKSKRIVTCGLTPTAIALIAPQVPAKMLHVMEDAQSLPLRSDRPGASDQAPLRWGKEAIGIGLLKALYAGVDIVFEAGLEVKRVHRTRSDHLVVIEEGEPLSEVIAANYAYAIGAGLVLIPPIPEETAEEIIEAFYSAQDSRSESASQILARLKERLRGLCDGVATPNGGSVTFISKSLPLGFGFPEIPSSHLFTYPDLGCSILNGLAAEQSDSRGVNIAAVVDPGTTPAPEIEEAAVSLASRGVLVRGYRGRNANVREITEMVECFPYDFLIVATHCGDVPGYRWTYDFTDSENIPRSLVVDIAIGVAASDDPEIVRVSRHMRFHSLDGIDWNDRAAKAKLYVGTAIRDFIKKRYDDLEPSHKAHIERVVGSAALQMSDSLYLPSMHSIANNQSPIILNNACSSWRELASRFIYAGARAYIGTLVPVSGVEAQELTRALLGRNFGKPLAHALWSSQRKIYGRDGRAPYVVTGVYPQRLRTKPEDTQRLLHSKLRIGLEDWTKRSRDQDEESDSVKKDTQERIKYYQGELAVLEHMAAEKRKR